MKDRRCGREKIEKAEKADTSSQSDYLKLVQNTSHQMPNSHVELLENAAKVEWLTSGKEGQSGIHQDGRMHSGSLE